MPDPTPAQTQATDTLRRFAMRYPEVEETTSCNRAAFRARKKNFFFVGPAAGAYSAMFRLGPSIDEAVALSERDPDTYGVGKTGWVTVKFDPEVGPPIETLERWLDESFRVLMPKKLLATLPEQGPPEA